MCIEHSTKCMCVILACLQVTKKHVDNYQPGKRIPSCQLLAEYDFAGVKVVPLRYRVKLLGAKEPHDMFTFTVTPPSSSVKHTKRSRTPPLNAGILDSMYSYCI